MKRILFIAGIAFLLSACAGKDQDKTEKKVTLSNQDSLMQAKKMQIMADTLNFTTLEWIDSSFQTLPKVKEGQQVEVIYRFRNTGDKPLIISSVSASCGCTVPEKPEEPIAPGAEAKIKAKFESSGRPGENRKNIYVDANTKPSRNHELGFSVFVDKK